MRVLEEPFLTRDALLAVLRPGEITTERPFRTLRQKRAASRGLPVVMRSTRGQVLGRVHLYSALNADAVRAYRLDRADVALELAERAERLERSDEARLVHRAVSGVASHLPVDPQSEEAPASLRRYIGLRRRSTWRGRDLNGLAREWLVHSGAWMTTDWDALVEAVVALDRSAEEARADVLGAPQTVSTFFGTVERMDPTSAELEAPDGRALLVPRDDLERQGLAVIGQPVALLREEMPGGGSYSLPMPAIALDGAPRRDAGPVWEEDFDDRVVVAKVANARDAAWLDRELAREPTAVPAVALSVS